MTTQHTFEFDVHIFDTDCYGVVWHGSYAKWLEMGRVDLFKVVGLNLTDATRDHDIIFPVVEQNLRYKASARFGDRLQLLTSVSQQALKLVFDQRIIDVTTGQRILEARTDIVMTNSAGKLVRKAPQPVAEMIARLTEAV